MELFILGTILGMGVMLLLQSIVNGFKKATQRRRNNFQAAVSAEVARRMQQAADPWAPELPTPAGPNGGRKFQPVRHP